MKVALIHPPFSLPTTPPLGIAYLKAYIKKNIPGIEMKCFDFNLDWHKYFFEGFEEKENKNEMEEKVASFRGCFSKENILNPEKYNQKAMALRDLLKSIHKQADETYADILVGGKGVDDALRDFAGDLIKYKPDVIAFSVCYNKQWHFASALARGIRGQLPGVKIVFGGSFFAVEPEKKFFGITMDYIVYGEGEIGLLQLLQNLKNSSGVPSLIYESKDGVKKNPPAVMNNLDLIPVPDYSDFDLGSYFNPEPVIPILTSRGCFYQKCAFCVHHKSYSSFRTRTISSVVSELKLHVSNGVKYFHFVDEMISPTRFEQLSQAIIEAGLDIRYLALGKPLKEFSSELTSLMHKSGCRMMVWGVESGSQKVLDKINKGTEIMGISSALKNSSLAGIKNHVFVMIGFPSETLEDFDKTVDFLFENKDWIHSIHRGPFSLNAGSYVFNFPEAFGIAKIFDKDKVLVEYPYEIKEGVDKNKAVELLFSLNDFFNSFNPYSDVLNTFREHALYVYSNKDIDYSQRKISSREEMQNTISYNV